jgi:hypothetical protein
MDSVGRKAGYRVLNRQAVPIGVDRNRDQDNRAGRELEIPHLFVVGMACLDLRPGTDIILDGVLRVPL